MGRGKPWLQHELDLLKRLADNGVPYKDIAPRVGHPVSSCLTMVSELRAIKQGLEPKYVRKQMIKAAAEARARPAVPQRVRNYEASRAPAVAPQPTSTFRYVMDAELRARIEGQGVTAGLLGDPVKGRSALDKITAGEQLPPPLLDSDLARFAPRRVAPRVTLAEGPLR